MHTRFAISISSLLFLVPAPVLSKPYGNGPFGVNVYTAMNFVDDEGEYYGVQVVIVPYSGGISVLWRSGVGNIARPLLLSAVQKGNVIRITVPDTDQNSGEWTLSVKGEAIKAVGPRGLHFDLRETALNCTSSRSR